MVKKSNKASFARKALTRAANHVKLCLSVVTNVQKSATSLVSVSNQGKTYLRMGVERGATKNELSALIDARPAVTLGKSAPRLSVRPKSACSANVGLDGSKSSANLFQTASQSNVTHVAGKSSEMRRSQQRLEVQLTLTKTRTRLSLSIIPRTRSNLRRRT